MLRSLQLLVVGELLSMPVLASWSAADAVLPVAGAALQATCKKDIYKAVVQARLAIPELACGQCLLHTSPTLNGIWLLRRARTYAPHVSLLIT
jgi:hypothetical protein